MVCVRRHEASCCAAVWWSPRGHSKPRHALPRASWHTARPMIPPPAPRNSIPAPLLLTGPAREATSRRA
eukprot:8944522-Heterocapsa_arctica.AAC.1